MPRQPHVRQLREDFAQRFGRPCTVAARAPGRVNLIGEHTDYNEGFVLPMALEQSTWVAAAPRDDGLVRAASRELGHEAVWPVEGGISRGDPEWARYVAGVAILLQRAGASLRGCDLLVQSDVPVGGGLSSSAALEVAVALALAQITGREFRTTDLADLCRAAEHEFAGVPCGLMDQYVCLLAQAERALLLDCRARTWEHVPLPLRDHVVLIVNSGVRHNLVAGEYAARQVECRRAVAYFHGLNPAVRALRDVNVETVEAHAGRLDSKAAARALHVTTENKRTLAAVAALRKGDLEEFGRLLCASHISLRDGYEVSCRELDLLVALLGAVPGVLGARLTGGGFGGCIVALAQRGSLRDVETIVREKYDGAGYGPARVLYGRPGSGATLEFP